MVTNVNNDEDNKEQERNSEKKKEVECSTILGLESK
jgi:hypothetical protein